MKTTTEQTTQDWLNETNQYEEIHSSKENRQQYADELQLLLKKDANKPKQIDKNAETLAKALANFDPTAPKITAKTFNQKTYDENDKKARDLFSTYLQNKGYNINSNEENYGVDIIATKNEKQSKFELEISSLSFTNKESFQYENVHFLARKEKMLKSGDYHYVIINKQCTHAVTALASNIFNQENFLTKYAGKERDGMDEFYKLPLNKVKFFSLNIDKLK